MEPPPSPDAQDLRHLRIDVLRRAIDVYLGIAYPSGESPEAVRRRLVWPPDADASTLLTRPPFERGGEGRDPGAPIYALRLGNARYPHMKLQIQPWPNPAGFMLSVNTHDQVLALDPDAADAPGLPRTPGREPAAQGGDRAGLGRGRAAHLPPLPPRLHREPGRGDWRRRSPGIRRSET